MGQVLEALLIFFTVFVAVCVGGPLWMRQRVRRHLRVRPATKSPAPTAWALSVTEPARLHRRLRNVATSARLSGSDGDATTKALAGQIEAEVVRLEKCLIALSPIWRTDRNARRQLTEQITELEHLAVRLATNAEETSRPAALTTGTPDGLTELRERLDALDDARQQLSSVERRSGVQFG